MTIPHEKAPAAVGNIAPLDEMRIAGNTPTPWQEPDRGIKDSFHPEIGHSQCDDRYLTIFADDDGDNVIHVHGGNQEANAAYIVAAVNKHAMLVEALKAADDLLADWREVHVGIDEPLHSNDKARLDIIDAALAEASA